MAEQLRRAENFGFRPHNLGVLELQKLIDRIPKARRGLIVIKPGFYPTDNQGYPLQSITEGLISAVGLNLVATSERCLTEPEIVKMYSTLFNPQAIRSRSTWKKVTKDVLGYLAGSRVFSYLLEGESAMKKCEVIKKTIRKRYDLRNGGVRVQNGVHVPDNIDEMKTDIDVLFGY